MSVYIKIKNAVLNEGPGSPVYLLIESSSAILKTVETPGSKNPFWQSSFICSIRERLLNFRICLNPYSNNHIPSSSSLQELRQNKTIAIGELPFQYFERNPGQESIMRLELVSQNDKGLLYQQGYLDLLVLYEPRKNYVGEMEFYEFGETVTYQNIQANNNIPELVQSNDRNPSIHQRMVSGNPPSKMTSSKEASKTRNLFNCCDRPVRDQDYQVFEPHYFHS